MKLKHFTILLVSLAVAFPGCSSANSSKGDAATEEISSNSSNIKTIFISLNISVTSSKKSTNGCKEPLKLGTERYDNFLFDFNICLHIFFPRLLTVFLKSSPSTYSPPSIYKTKIFFLYL